MQCIINFNLFIYLFVYIIYARERNDYKPIILVSLTIKPSIKPKKVVRLFIVLKKLLSKFQKIKIK